VPGAATAAASKLLERDASIFEALCLSAGADIFLVFHPRAPVCIGRAAWPLDEETCSFGVLLNAPPGTNRTGSSQCQRLLLQPVSFS